MNKIKFRDDIDQIIDDINSSLKAPVIAISSIESQWKRGNGSVVRIDTKDIATLSINLHDGFYGVGCDGSKSGINEYLALNLKLHRHNSQNIRYRCTLTQLKSVIRHYASTNA
ncbi:hypothetical protein ACV0LO_003275 [Vibrio cholerae]|uniref:hypothetical protein n=1 Tax=Vibrio cholerae TaxID=666 RepID=UPI0018F0B31F|nr:hypothetical protein [Vibrio cholerae]MBJ6922892.1 hypothetical protein [Vibrio cholerae]